MTADVYSVSAQKRERLIKGAEVSFAGKESAPWTYYLVCRDKSGKVKTYYFPLEGRKFIVYRSRRGTKELQLQYLNYETQLQDVQQTLRLMINVTSESDV